MNNMSNIIIPSSVDEKSVRVPMQFPLRADADSVVDSSHRVVFTMDNSVEIGESLKFCKLFAKAPEMFETLGEAYAALAIIASNSGMTHGTPDEEDKDTCLLCKMERLLVSIQ